jgi:basic membrane lipoprotein Med (substrate-binding protein (PBP1-ABC) superfamily)
MAQRAEEFVNARADVLTGSSQAVIGALAVCRDRNALWFGTQWSQAALAPARVVSSQVYDWRVVLRKILNDVIAGRLGGRALSITLRNHGESITFNPRYPLPPAVRAAARKTIIAIENGRIAVPQ